jgi:hypothetical protein
MINFREDIFGLPRTNHPQLGQVGLAAGSTLCNLQKHRPLCTHLYVNYVNTTNATPKPTTKSVPGPRVPRAVRLPLAHRRGAGPRAAGLAGRAV